MIKLLPDSWPKSHGTRATDNCVVPSLTISMTDEELALFYQAEEDAQYAARCENFQFANCTKNVTNNLPTAICQGFNKRRGFKCMRRAFRKGYGLDRDFAYACRTAGLLHKTR